MNRPDFRALLNPHLAELEEYAPIEPFEVLSARLKIPAERIVKLDANENPYGPLPAVTEALARYPYFHIYPDPAQSELRDALGAFIGVPAAHILPGHGADELLDCLCRMFLAPGDAVINTPPTFGMYSFDARLAGAKVVDVAATRTSPWMSRRSRKRSRRTARSSCSSPPPTTPRATGSTTGRSSACSRCRWWWCSTRRTSSSRITRAAPARVLDRDNLVVLRTFSKAAGIAGLRLGYGVFPQWLMRELWKFKQPYNVNAAASVAGIASLRNAEQIEAVVEKLKAERSRLYSLLGTLPGIEAVPGSQGNFILCRVVRRDARDLKLALERIGVLVRHYDKPGLAGCIRISVGRPEHTDALIGALRDLT